MKKDESLQHEIKKYVGEKGYVHLGKGQVQVEVMIVDLNRAYGRNQYLITPVAGKGEVWVREVKLIK